MCEAVRALVRLRPKGLSRSLCLLLGNSSFMVEADILNDLSELKDPLSVPSLERRAAQLAPLVGTKEGTEIGAEVLKPMVDRALEAIRTASNAKNKG